MPSPFLFSSLCFFFFFLPSPFYFPLSPSTAFSLAVSGPTLSAFFSLFSFSLILCLATFVAPSVFLGPCGIPLHGSKMFRRGSLCVRKKYIRTTIAFEDISKVSTEFCRFLVYFFHLKYLRVRK